MEEPRAPLAPVLRGALVAAQGPHDQCLAPADHAPPERDVEQPEQHVEDRRHEHLRQRQLQVREQDVQVRPGREKRLDLGGIRGVLLRDERADENDDEDAQQEKDRGAHPRVLVPVLPGSLPESPLHRNAPGRSKPFGSNAPARPGCHVRVPGGLDVAVRASAGSSRNVTAAITARRPSLRARPRSGHSRRRP